MNYLNDKSFPKDQPKAVVRAELCDGCAFCVDVCPIGCLSVVQNSNRKEAHIIKIESEDCSGCGACQGTCPKEAIYIPGLSVDDLRQYVYQSILTQQQA